MQDASILATAHYPETLDRIFIIGAPAFFPTVWGWIKRWFDPITVSKIFILSHDKVTSTLSSYIDPANIPKMYGGELEFNFGMMPIPDKAIKERVTWTSATGDTQSVGGEEVQTFPIGPLKWVKHESGDKVALAVGSVEGKERKENIALLHPYTKEKENGIVANGHAVS